jgi:4-amino-4-deoxy-L-arabinose transferase-like glycosyltransferase
MWPCFLVLTLVNGILFVVLPPYEGGPPAVFPGVILALFGNLLAVAVLAPLAGLLLRRRRRDLPRFVATDYAGAMLLCGITVALLVGGIAHRGAHQAEQDREQAVAQAMHDYVVSSARRYQGGLDHIDAIRLEPDRYRVCVPAPDNRRALCLLVRTDQRPVGITVDPDREPNGAFHRTD